MKAFIFIFVMALSLVSNAQIPYYPMGNGTQMTATQTTTVTDQKFETLHHSFEQCKQQVKQQLIQESINNRVINKAAINKLISDIQLLFDAAESKFTTTTNTQIIVDSLQTVNQIKAYTTEIARLKAETIVAGSDSAMIRPSIDQLKKQRARLIQVRNSWMPVVKP